MHQIGKIRNELIQIQLFCHDINVNMIQIFAFFQWFCYIRIDNTDKGSGFIRCIDKTMIAITTNMADFSFCQYNLTIITPMNTAATYTNNNFMITKMAMKRLSLTRINGCHRDNGLIFCPVRFKLEPMLFPPVLDNIAYNIDAIKIFDIIYGFPRHFNSPD